MQGFNEMEWIRLVFLLADTQRWVDDLGRDCFMQVPGDKKKLFKKDYYLTVTALAHILERHYYKINRHPQTGKFHIPVPDILGYLREAQTIEPKPMQGGCNYYRVLDTGREIGFDKDGKPVNALTIITDRGGRIVTAFPCEGMELK